MVVYSFVEKKFKGATCPLNLPLHRCAYLHTIVEYCLRSSALIVNRELCKVEYCTFTRLNSGIQNTNEAEDKEIIIFTTTVIITILSRQMQ